MRSRCSIAVPRAGALIAIAAFAAFGCGDEPELLCDGERLVWSLADVGLSMEQDVSPEPGLQVDVALQTTLTPGIAARLDITRGDGEPEPGPTVEVGDVGQLMFPAVTLPSGRVRLTVVADNGCREVRSSRRVFVFDDQGDATCRVALPGSVGAAGARFFNAAADADGEAPGFQAQFSVESGRDDVEVQLMVLDIEQATEQVLVADSDAGGSVGFALDLEDRPYAVRAICRWSEIEAPRVSATHQVTVDTVAPDCAIDAPLVEVGDGDDLDGNLDNGIQFEVVASTTATDAEGTIPLFEVDGNRVAGSAVDGDGRSTAEATLPSPPPAEQNISVTLVDAAGNPCQAQVSL